MAVLVVASLACLVWHEPADVMHEPCEQFAADKLAGSLQLA